MRHLPGGHHRRFGRAWAGAALAALVAATGPAATAARPPAATAPGPGGHASPGRPGPPGDGGEAGHEESEGFRLVAAKEESVSQGPGCPEASPRRSYEVVATTVDITLNRYLDHDPEGRMYVLEQDVARVRDEVARNEAARSSGSEPAVSVGLQGDAIQPLTLRVNQGDCLSIRLRDDLPPGEAATLHLHGSSLRVAGTGRPAVATTPAAVARPGRPVTYEWLVPASEPEGVHYFHSHGDDRRQTSHGLFGAVVVEPRGSAHLDPASGRALPSGWAAVIRGRDGKAFREFALYYHEIGDETYQVRDRAGGFVPLVDPLLGAYRPGARALNYRSEPFMNRLALQQATSGRFDESLAYSSYTFGDPATPVMRTYLGEPVKERVVHGGSEVFHVHHVHGGAIRWRRQPGVEPAGARLGLDKHPPLLPRASERIDAQAVGPSETFDAENECGAGGCQQSVGDFLVHCHVAHHYFAGMWAIWRVYNTKQQEGSATDALPPLAELPDRRGRVRPAVTSDRLVGTTVDSYGRRSTIAAPDLGPWVERQLPPPGTPRGYDASVLDWQRQGDVYLNEAETDQAWPGYRARAPATRPPLLFDPVTGKLAYPFLRPHLGRRPPFAPNHGPAPFLDPAVDATDPPAPGQNGAGSLCPEGTTLKTFAVNAVTLPVTLNAKANVVDPEGEMFVLRPQLDAVRADNALRRPLAIRANAGQDCVDLVLRSELQDTPTNHGFAKVNAHIHLVQFDVQASDGVITGFNYEQSVRPFAVEGERLTAPEIAGSLGVTLTGVGRFQPGVLVGVGMEEDRGFEVRRVREIQGSSLLFDRPLANPHPAGVTVSTEFVRYRWYPDVQFGTAYFHDHVNALASWRHGLFGALVAEPPGSTYHDPRSGVPVESGPVADVRTDGRVSADVTGSFRELVTFLQDDNPRASVGRSSGSSLNLRVEPLDGRPGDRSLLFSSAQHGDPETPVLEAYLGDPVVVRTLVAGTNDVHSWHLDGHWFRTEPHSRTSPPTATADVGISERADLSVARAGGPQRMPGDYLYYNGRSFKLREGSWGLLRVRRAGDGAGLQKLPGHEQVPNPAPDVCPAGAPRRRYAVVAVDATLPMLGGDKGKIYVLAADREAVTSGREPPEPLVLHVGVGDCIEVELANATTDGPVSFHADLLAHDPSRSAGVAAGNEPGQAVGPGGRRTYRLYASPEVGETTALVRDWGDVLRNPGLGLYGAIVVGAPGTTWTDPHTGADVSAGSAWKADAHPREGAPYRDFTLFMQDEDAGMGTHRMPYNQRVAGVVGLNYRAAPLGERSAGGTVERAGVFRSDVGGPPATPLLEAFAGDRVRVHALAPWSEQAQVFSVEGHRWAVEQGRRGSHLVGSAQLGALDALSLELDGGAGGPEGLAGDYLYGDHREPYREAGLWGLFRVHPACSRTPERLRPLRGACNGRASATAPWSAAMLVLLGGGAVFASLTRSRRRGASPAGPEGAVAAADGDRA